MPTDLATQPRPSGAEAYEGMAVASPGGQVRLAACGWLASNWGGGPHHRHRCSEPARLTSCGCCECRRMGCLRW